MFARCLLIAALLAATALSAPAARRELRPHARRSARPAPRRLSDDSGPSPEPSPFFGREGERWTPDGPFMDFSYSGYRNSDEDIPRPPVTRELWDFRGNGRSESGALRAMVEWANDQPESEGFIVLSLPAGQIDLQDPLVIRRSKTVLRGAGKGRTMLAISRSLRQELGRGNYEWSGAWLTIEGSFQGSYEGERLARTAGYSERGSYTLKVDSTDRLREGQLVTVRWSGNRRELADEIMNNQADPGRLYKDQAIYYTSEIRKIEGREVTLRRALPLAVKDAFDVELVARVSTVRDSGIEDLAVVFDWDRYRGHHNEEGYNGVELVKVQDCWLSNVAIVNSDSGVLVSSSSRVTVQGLDVAVTRSRDGSGDNGPWDGHWGVRAGLSADVLVKDFSIAARVHHAIGADSHSQFCAFAGGRIPGGNMELHRSQISNILFTDIDAERSDRAFSSGGSASAGPATGAFTTFWNIRSASGEHALPEHNGGSPGSCAFGPAVNFIGVAFRRQSRLCDSWIHQSEPVVPGNLFRAQLWRRKGLQG